MSKLKSQGIAQVRKQLGWIIFLAISLHMDGFSYWPEFAFVHLVPLWFCSPDSKWYYSVYLNIDNYLETSFQWTLQCPLQVPVNSWELMSLWSHVTLTFSLYSINSVYNPVHPPSWVIIVPHSVNPHVKLRTRISPNLKIHIQVNKNNSHKIFVFLTCWDTGIYT